VCASQRWPHAPLEISVNNSDVSFTSRMAWEGMPASSSSRKKTFQRQPFKRSCLPQGNNAELNRIDAQDEKKTRHRISSDIKHHPSMPVTMRPALARSRGPFTPSRVASGVVQASPVRTQSKLCCENLPARVTLDYATNTCDTVGCATAISSLCVSQRAAIHRDRGGKRGSSVLCTAWISDLARARKSRSCGRRRRLERVESGHRNG
jgi:hypothetical protein